MAEKSISNDLLKSVRDLVAPWGDVARTGKIVQEPAKRDVGMVEEPSLAATDPLRPLREQAMTMARQFAGAEGRSLFTQEDYLRACLSPEINQQARDSGIARGDWNARNFMDFSGMDIRDMRMTREGFKPQGESRERLTQAVNDAMERGDYTPHVPDAGERESAQIGEEAISTFFAELDTHPRFDGTKFYNVHFHPADTFDEYVKGEAALVEGCTFEGIDRQVQLVGGEFRDVRFADIKTGGQITIGSTEPDASATTVHGLHLEGVVANVTIGRATIDGLTVDTATRILQLEAQEGAVIRNAQFGASTLSMASKLTGSHWQEVTFDGTNLQDVDFSGASLSNVTFKSTELAGVNLSGAVLHNVEVDGRLITHPNELAALGANVDGAQLKYQPPQEQVGSPASPKNLADAVASLSPSIRGGEAVDLDTAFTDRSGNAIASMDKPKELIRESDIPLPSRG